MSTGVSRSAPGFSSANDSAMAWESTCGHVGSRLRIRTAHRRKQPQAAAADVGYPGGEVAAGGAPGPGCAGGDPKGARGAAEAAVGNTEMRVARFALSRGGEGVRLVVYQGRSGQARVWDDAHSSFTAPRGEPEGTALRWIGRAGFAGAGNLLRGAVV
jgi:hypothetical protein